MSFPGTSTAPKRKNHPLFYLRLGLIKVSVLGLILTLLSLPDAYRILTPIIYAIVIFAVSIAFALYDLGIWVVRRRLHSRVSGNGRIALPVSATHEPLMANEAGNNDDDNNDGDDGGDPKWPHTHVLLLDGILLVLHELAFWVLVFSWGRHNRNGAPGFSLFAHSWASLASLVASIVHAVAFAKQWKARQKKDIKSRLLNVRCRRCGDHFHHQDSSSSSSRADAARREQEAVPHHHHHQGVASWRGSRDAADVRAETASDGSDDARLIIVPDQREVAAAQSHEPLWSTKGDRYMPHN